MPNRLRWRHKAVHFDRETETPVDTPVNLTSLTFLSLANKRLQDLSQLVRDWAGRFDPTGLGMQNHSDER